MRKDLENKLTMYEGVLSLLRENDQKVQPIPKFVESVTAFSSTIDIINEKSVTVNTVSAGKTKDKSSAEKQLVECLSEACPALFLLGNSLNDMAMVERNDIPEYKIRKLRDINLALFGEEISTLATKNANALIEYGFLEDSVTMLSEKSAAYSDSIGLKESGVSSRVGTRVEMTDFFKKADYILEKELDKFMEIIKRKNSEFYKQYQATRTIKDTGVRHRKDEETEKAPEGTGV